LAKTVEEASLIRDQFKIPHDAKVIIKTAAFRPEKNHKAAVDAFSLLNKKGLSNVFLLFVGDGQSDTGKGEVPLGSGFPSGCSGTGTVDS
jgi:hypothetical protein